METIKKIAVITAISAGLIFSVLSLGFAAFAQQENATSSSPSTTGQLTKGEIKKGDITGGNITKGTVQERDSYGSRY